MYELAILAVAVLALMAATTLVAGVIGRALLLVECVLLAGAILGGSEIGRIFIENSRHHAGMIAASIERKRRLVTA